jgi:outer membrane protein assembly factor BamE (lipoprotein component of BamABCDE complex)
MKKSYLIILAVLLSLTACASTKIQSEGNKITREQAERIKPGITTKSIVIDTFGNPSMVDSKPDGTEVLIYTYTEKRTPTYFGEFIVNERQSQRITITLEITIKDGLVSSYNFKKQEE